MYARPCVVSQGDRMICRNCGHRMPSSARDPIPLTPAQRRLYDFVRAHVAGHGYAPSFEEIARHLTYTSLSTVYEHLQNLEAKGWIRRDRNRARAITCLVFEERPGVPDV